jgi:uncharacterized membrane protein YgdD (TMEM256/DUF423 family)
MRGKWWLALGAFFVFAGVALGAFGAHGLKTALGQWELPPEEQERRLENWETAARYQMVHALALVCVGILAAGQPRRTFDAAAAAFCGGVVIFSGGLYTYVLTGDRVWAMIVPLGGVLLLAGWGALVIGSLRIKRPDKEAPERHAPDGRH